MARARPTDWPLPTAESRPWTRWWWLGSAVDKATLTQLLETYAKAGLGGVEVTSIYGVQGEAHRNIDYLSSAWIETVRHTIAEAHRLGMQVDLPPGSGWRMGGPFITDKAAAAKLHIEKSDTTRRLTAEVRPSGEPVKRAGPGGAGRAFNPFSRRSLQAVIDFYTPHFRDLDIRAQFHDSWEYASNACPELFDCFRERRGYDLEAHLAALAGQGDSDEHARVTYDVQRTLAELALEAFIVPWTAWCHSLGQQSRNQAHGSPGNLLDLYAAADIPETEVFRNVTPDTPLMSKFASSAAHVAGRRLTSSETATWLGEHFHVSLADIKQLADNLFVAGINHHVYHGTAYSPPDVEWPGWLFYASTQLNPQNPIWRDLPTLNAYVTRCQSILQAGTPDNDLLVYFPVHDVLHDPARELATHLAIGGTWFKELAATDTFRQLWQRGYAFDYISDRQIAEIRIAGDRLVTPGASYQAIVVPPCTFLPVETLAHLSRLSGQGAHVVFVSPAPGDVPGWANLDERRKRFQDLMAQVTPCADLAAALADIGIERERLADVPGFACIRRRHDAGRHYFIVNEGEDAKDEWVPLANGFDSVLIMDPMSGQTGLARTRGDSPCEVRLQLAPGASCVLGTFDEPLTGAPAWPYAEPCGPAQELQGVWQVEFLSGGPELPPSFQTEQLASWTATSEAAERFAGTARYGLAFDAPGRAEAWQLALGDVRASARVRLNGRDVATLIGPSFTTTLRELEPTGNVLEVEVTNLAANRIRDLDRRGVAWRVFEDINFVSRQYGPFDAADWPVLPSGLLGPVRLAPLKNA